MTTSYTLRDIPNGDLWRKVKILAAIKGITIKQLIINLLIKEIKEYDTKSVT
jgi:hypothetical protein